MRAVHLIDWVIVKAPAKAFDSELCFVLEEPVAKERLAFEEPFVELLLQALQVFLAQRMVFNRTGVAKIVPIAVVLLDAEHGLRLWASQEISFKNAIEKEMEPGRFRLRTGRIAICTGSGGARFGTATASQSN